MSRTKIPKAPSEHEARFKLQLRANKIYVFKEQYRFHPTRQWKIDFAFPSAKLGIELDGAIFGKKSGHNTGVGILRKMEKSNELQKMGWRIFSFSGDQVKSGYAINYILEVLNELQ